ncbi:MAG: hypothetical protein K2W85_11325 [Phycisphaerales bacterium]|nr:hypothetical protein [Phycisphaerales bacterium]
MTRQALHRTRSDRRNAGSVLVAVIVALVLVQTAVLASVIAARVPQDTTLRRVDAARTLYAAEGGMHMALKEVYDATDLDGDGTVGSISADASAANDPTISSAQVSVTTSTSGSTTTLTASSRTATAARKVLVATLTY